MRSTPVHFARTFLISTLRSSDNDNTNIYDAKIYINETHNEV